MSDLGSRHSLVFLRELKKNTKLQKIRIQYEYTENKLRP